MEKLTRIVLANHHPLIRGDLRLLLERQAGFHVTGEGANGREAVLLAEYRRPEIVLLDVQLPLLNGLAAARAISAQTPAPGIIFVTALTDQEYVSEAFKAGARGYVLADNAQADLVSSVNIVAAGGSFLSPAIAARLIEEYLASAPPDRPNLTATLQHLGLPKMVVDSIGGNLPNAT